MSTLVSPPRGPSTIYDYTSTVRYFYHLYSSIKVCMLSGLLHYKSSASILRHLLFLSSFFYPAAGYLLVHWIFFVFLSSHVLNRRSRRDFFKKKIFFWLLVTLECPFSCSIIIATFFRFFCPNQHTGHLLDRGEKKKKVRFLCLCVHLWLQCVLGS